MKNSILARLLAYILSTSIVLLIGISALNYIWAQKMVVDVSEKRAAALADSATARLETFLLLKGQYAWMLAQNEQIHAFVQKVSSRDEDLSHDATYQEMHTSFDRIVQQDSDIKHVYIAVEKSQRLYGNIEFEYPEHYRVGPRPWYKTAVANGKLSFTPPYICPLTNYHVLTASVPLYDSEGELLGVAAVDILVDKVQEIVNELHIFEDDYAFLIDDKGNPIAYPNNRHVQPLKMLDESYPHMNKVISDMLEGRKGMTKIGNDENAKYVFFAPINNTGWFLGFMVPVEEVTSPVLALGKTSLLTVFIGVFVLFILITVLTSRITRPVNKLSRLMKDIAGGDYTLRAEVKSNDEIGTLSRSLNSLLEKKQQLIKQVKEKAYKMGVAGHELAITIGEARTTLPMVTSDLSTIIKNPTLDKKERRQEQQKYSQAMHVFLERLFMVNYSHRLINARIEDLKSLLQENGGTGIHADTNARAETAPAGDTNEPDSGISDILDEIKEEVAKVLRLTEAMQGDFEDISTSIEETSKELIDITSILEIMGTHLKNISLIQSDSVDRASKTSIELVEWSQALLQITSAFKIENDSGNDNETGI
ncbi:MAG TPA: HAMP domain-containing protein [Deltaproteobacteria bacterium]|nr:HAMP domain-containing protein [Deltaproteobacteria bacterium]